MALAHGEDRGTVGSGDTRQVGGGSGGPGLFGVGVGARPDRGVDEEEVARERVAAAERIGAMEVMPRPRSSNASLPRACAP